MREELAAYGADPTWFGLGDRDIATHLVRTRMLRAGYPLSAGHRGAVPPLAPGRARCCPPPTTASRPTSSSTTRRPAEGAQGHPLPGVVDPAQGRAARARVRLGRRRRGHRAAGRAGRDRRRRRRAARPVQPGGEHRHDRSTSRACAQALAATPAPVVGLSPIVGGRPLRGMADACLDAIGVETTAEAVGPALRRARPTAACSTAGWCTPATPPTCPASRCARCRC